MDKQSNLTQEERDVWTDAFKFHATFAKMGNAPEEWIKCAHTITQLSIKHKNHPLAGILFMAVYTYLEKEREVITVD